MLFWDILYLLKDDIEIFKWLCGVYREKEARQQKMMQDLLKSRPEIGDKILQKQFTGGKR